MDEVVAAFLALDSPSECASFLDAMFTPQELKQIPTRWGLLKTLMSKEMSQRKLADYAGVAPATAARAHKAFQVHEQLLRNLVQRIGGDGDDEAERGSTTPGLTAG
jgi:uncharacterized protein YerC